VLEGVGVIGGRMPGKERAVNTGDPQGRTAMGSRAGVRAVIVAMSPGNAGGAKGGRKAGQRRTGKAKDTMLSAPRAKRHGVKNLPGSCSSLAHDTAKTKAERGDQ
jgi:hypothetical protein